MKLHRTKNIPNKKGNGTAEMAQYIQPIAAKPNDLSSIPGIHMVEGEN